MCRSRSTWSPTRSARPARWSRARRRGSSRPTRSGSSGCRRSVLPSSCAPRSSRTAASTACSSTRWWTTRCAPRWSSCAEKAPTESTCSVRPYGCSKRSPGTSHRRGGRDPANRRGLLRSHRGDGVRRQARRRAQPRGTRRGRRRAHRRVADQQDAAFHVSGVQGLPRARTSRLRRASALPTSCSRSTRARSSGL